MIRNVLHELEEVAVPLKMGITYALYEAPPMGPVISILMSNGE
jgi:hypothetical protein